MEVELRGRSQTITKWPKSIKVNESWSSNEGLFVKAGVNNKALAFLVDTGANVTILSKHFINNQDPSLQERIEPVNISLITATGESAPFVGQIKLKIGIGTKIYDQNVLIADIANDGILGMDFLVDHQCDVLLSQNKLKIKGEIIQCFHYASSAKSSYRVAIQETVEVPASSEIIVYGKSSDPVFRGNTGLIEPYDQFVEKNGVLVARVIVNPDMYNIPLRLINVQDKPCTLYEGAIVAHCHRITDNNIQTSEVVNSIASGSDESKKGGQLPSHLLDVYESSKEDLDENQRDEFKNLLIEYGDIFSKNSDDLGVTNLVEHTINTGYHAPVRQRPRRIPLARMADAEAEIQKLLKQDVIEPSSSPWNSNIVLVKKSDNTWRFCIDYRAVNEAVIKNSHPLPRIDDTIDALSGAKFFSNVDLKAGYFQIPVAERDRPKTSFSFPGGGSWQFKRMPMGLCNSAPVFERLMEKVLTGLTFKVCLVYLDDIIIYSKSFETHIRNLREVFQRLKAANLKLSPKKCHFLKKQVKFLGHVVSQEGVATDPSKIEAVKDWPIPKSIKDVRSFLGLTSYYRKFIKGYAEKAKPLYKVTEKNQRFSWSEDCQISFKELKDALISAPILAYPTSEGNFILDTDASNLHMGAVLSQVQEGVEKVICYFSKTFSRSERRYCVTRRELLAVVSSIKHFHHYLYGRHFLVRSDHGALRWLFNFKNPEGQLARWFEVLASYDFRIEHRAGRSHNNADALSRRPCIEKECPHCLRAETNYEICQNQDDFLMKNRGGNSKFNEASLGGPSWELSELGRTNKDIKGDQMDNPDLVQTIPKDVRICTRAKNYENQSKDDSSRSDLKTIEESQLADPVISTMLKWKQQNYKPKWEEISHMSPEIKFFWARLESLIVINGILYRKWEKEKGKPDLHLIIPESLKEMVMNQIHNSITGGHLGVKKCLSKIKSRYFWYKMRRDIRVWCEKCDICASKKAPCRKPKAPLQQYLVGSPWERVAIDILGPLPTSFKGNQYLMVVQDYFSKWAEAIPIPNMEAVTVAQSFIERVVTIFGVPLSIHTDQGSNFESQVFKEMCQILGIHKTRTTPFRPKSDGMVERSNSTIETMLSAFVSSHQRDWDELIYLLMLAYRSGEHESLGTSPCSMIFGKDVNLPIDLILGKPKQEESNPVGKSAYAYELSKQIDKIHEFARNKLKLSSDRMKKYYDVGSRLQKFEKGSAVWLHNPRRKKGLCPKLQRSWEGPFVIINPINDVIYKIQKGPKTKPKVVHQDRLKPYNGNNIPTWFQN